jgi:ATP-dependent 26S proteasome regulatory subunit
MDGLAEDVDVLFVLTTNRPEILEPALAARPGRIDLAIEVPLPDADCRRRLLELYGRGLKLELTEPDKLIARTEGASGAFIRELAALRARMRPSQATVRTSSANKASPSGIKCSSIQMAPASGRLVPMVAA